MPNQHDIAAWLAEMATLLELSDANPFKVRAYANGARVVEGLGNFEPLVASEQLTSIKGIGAGLAAHITEALTTGTMQELETLRRAIPAGVVAMTRIPNVGPKKARVLWQELQVTSFAQLEAACRQGRVAALAGMGEKTQAKILAGLAALQKHQDAYLFPTAWEAAGQLESALRGHRAVREMAIAGSLRRCLETIHDVDLVVATDDPEAVMAEFTGHALVAQVLQQGETKASVRLKTGMQADLRCVTAEQFPYALLYFTGSKAHNTALRGRAKDLGLKLNEYGLWKPTKAGERLVPCRDEAAIYTALDLAYVPPELREDMGEWALAETGQVPALIESQDVRGIFHCHTTDSDGKASLAEMVAAAAARGWQYLGISDHSQSAHYAGGLSPERLRAQGEAIDRINATQQQVRVFKGVECDILKDGGLDYTDEVLAQLDFVIISVHAHLTLPRAAMTERVCRALQHPAVRILAHPTGRLLLSREPYEIDMDAVLRTAGQHGVVVEINANPRRAELDWRLGALARQYGVRTMINPDAHRPEQLDYVHGGVGIARKGGWSAQDVVNTWTPACVGRWVKHKN